MKAPHLARGWLLLMLLTACALLPTITPTSRPTEMPTPSATITETPVLVMTVAANPTAPVEPRLAEVYRHLPGIVLVAHISVVNSGDQQALYVEAVVSPGYNRIGTVDIMRRASYDVIPSTTTDVYITLDDGTTASDYVWLNSRNDWAVTPLTTVTHIPSPVPTPYQGTMPTRTWDCSADIYDCKALTCQEVWSYVMACPGDASGLDENRNGRPCEHLCD